MGEEKKYLLELQELKRNRPKVSKVNQMEDNLTAFREGTSTADMKATIQEINAAMAKHREEKKGIQEKLGKIKEQREAKFGDVPKWYEERKALGEQVQEKIKEKNVIRDEFRAKEKEYYAYLAEVRKARQARQQEERDAWQKERE